MTIQLTEDDVRRILILLILSNQVLHVRLGLSELDRVDVSIGRTM